MSIFVATQPVSRSMKMQGSLKASFGLSTMRRELSETMDSWVLNRTRP